MDRQCSSCGGFCRKSGCERENVEPTPDPIYAAPPQREWVGLTDEEMFAALVQVDPLTKRLAPGFEYFARAIEAKLKEKNT